MNEALYEETARIATALSSPVRLRALNLLFQAERSVGELAELLDESPANTAAHLKVLRAAGLVTAHKRGKQAIHAASGPHALALFMALRGAAETLSPTVRLLASEPDELDEPGSNVAMDELLALDPKRSLLLDLRPADEYASGHLPGAVSVPFDAVGERLSALPKRRRVLVYCRGKYCPTARTGTAALREAGLRAEWLPFGVPEWRAAGYPVTVGGA